jgi:hypothetical protein
MTMLSESHGFVWFVSRCQIILTINVISLIVQTNIWNLFQTGTIHHALMSQGQRENRYEMLVLSFVNSWWVKCTNCDNCKCRSQCLGNWTLIQKHYSAICVRYHYNSVWLEHHWVRYHGYMQWKYFKICNLYF